MPSRDDIVSFFARAGIRSRSIFRSAITKRAALAEIALALALTLVVCKFVNWDIPNSYLRQTLGADKGMYSAVEKFVETEADRLTPKAALPQLKEPTKDEIDAIVLFGHDPNKSPREQTTSAFVSRPLVARWLADQMVNGSPDDEEVAKLRAEVRTILDEKIKLAYAELTSTVAYAWRRYTTGWIQYITIFFFLVAAVRMGFWRYWLVVEHMTIVGKDLPRHWQAFTRYGLGVIDEPRSLKQRIAETAAGKFSRTLREFRDDTARTDLRPFRCVPLLSRLEKENGSRSRHPLATRLPIIDAGVEQLERQFDIENHPIRWLIAALPALGFVGTILGIGSGLGQADKPIGAVDKAGRIAAVQDLTSALGVAFDTTLVALLLSLVATALMMLNERLRGQYLFDLRSVLLDGPGASSSSRPAASGEAS